MKTPKEWFEEELSGEPLTEESVIEVIKMVQEEVIEETVKLCAKNAEVTLLKSGKQIEVKTPILESQFYEKGNGDLVPQGYAQVGMNTQLKYENESIIVDKQSILNCAEILKKEL